jgi:hypothetical protein
MPLAFNRFAAMPFNRLRQQCLAFFHQSFSGSNALAF